MDYFVRLDGKPYSRADYYANPQDYRSEFHTRVRLALTLLLQAVLNRSYQIAPYLSLLLNGAGWAPGFPRLMTNDQLAIALENAQRIGRGRFTCVGDISCDVEVCVLPKGQMSRSAEIDPYSLQGGLQFMPRPSTLSEPFFKTRPTQLPAHIPSLTMMSVDILPTALPLEASQHFSNALVPYLKVLVDEYRDVSISGGAEKHRQALDRATVARDGVLTESHAWLVEPLSTWKISLGSGGALQASGSSVVSSSNTIPGVQRKKKVLLLGSGLVAKPTVDEICKRPDLELVIGPF